MPPLRFAIIDPNILACLGLKDLLLRLIPAADAQLFTSAREIETLCQRARLSDREEFVHYFVASCIFFQQRQFFCSPGRRVIVLTTGDMQIAGCWTLNVCQREQELKRSILALMHDGHKHAAQAINQYACRGGNDRRLSPRETEVAVLLTKGLINKEVAERLNISPATVISHRRNIMEKLHARSLADITIYCVLNGLVDV